MYLSNTSTDAQEVVIHKNISDSSQSLQIEEQQEIKKLQVKATAYTINDAGMNGLGITSTGTKARPWYTIAADPKIIPMNSKVFISALIDTPSRGWFRVEDTGGAIRGHRLDICMPTRKEALQFGVKHLEVHVYTEGDNF
jgi:3D (Asp-Asp-Asp) domain-containing protein